MRVTTKSRYAVRALLNLANRPNGKPTSLAQIAGEEQISLNFLEQIFMSLRRNGIVKSVRGPAGGYLLARSPDAINVADILRAVGEPLYPVKCVDAHAAGKKSACSREEICMAREAWIEMGENIRMFLEALTLSHILDKKF